jgi:hypothetical protein
MIKVRQTFGAHAGRSREFHQDVIRFGRQPSNDIAFDPHADLDASGNHAEVRREAGQWLLVDLGSRNGTIVGGRPIQRHVLSSGDEVEFGTGGPRVRIEIDEPPRRGAPTAPPTPLDLGAAPSGATVEEPPRPSPPMLAPAPQLTPPHGSAFPLAPVQRAREAAVVPSAGAPLPVDPDDLARAVDLRLRPLLYGVVGLGVVLCGVICILGAVVLYLLARG